MNSENKISSEFENKEDQAQICAEGSEETYLTPYSITWPLFVF